MSEFEDKLNTILSNPDMMSQIMGLAQSLGGGTRAEVQAPERSDHREEQAPAEASSPLSLLSSIDPRFLDMAVRMMNAYQSGDDRRTDLLNALRPFVRQERYAKLDQAIRITKLTQAIRIAIDTFRDREGGQSHV